LRWWRWMPGAPPKLIHFPCRSPTPRKHGSFAIDGVGDSPLMLDG
jgi:hypothetical protein